MKKINKKGFTLIELLAVLVILSIIMTIALPSVTSSIERSKDKERNIKIGLIESAAELYADRYRNSVVYPITIKNLVDKGLLKKEEIEDPNNSGKTICGYVSSDFKFTESEVNSDYCVSLTS